MSKKKKSKVEKETRRIMEAMADVVKKKNGVYKFKAKNKKQLKKLKSKCIHWIAGKKGERPTVIKLDDGRWHCTLCGAEFNIRPLEMIENGDGTITSPYELKINEAIEITNQLQFYSVKLGGDKEDTKMFMEVKQLLRRMKKSSRQIIKRINQRENFEKNRERGDVMSQFDAYGGGINYR